MAGQRVVKRAHSNCEDEAIKENPVKRFFATKIAVNATGWIDPLKDHLSRMRISSSCKMYISTSYKILSALSSCLDFFSFEISSHFCKGFPISMVPSFHPRRLSTQLFFSSSVFYYWIPPSWVGQSPPPHSSSNCPESHGKVLKLYLCVSEFSTPALSFDQQTVCRRGGSAKSRPNWAAERITLLFHHIHRVLTDVAMFPLFHFTGHCLKVCEQWNDDENDLLQSGNLKS